MNANMIEDSFYLTEPKGLRRAMELTEMSSDEIEALVGRFRKNHYRFAGKLKGEVVISMDGAVEIRHHFKKTKLWCNIS